MALTKVTGDFIKAGSITQGHLHSSHGITTSHITEGDKLFFTNARVDSRVGSLSTSDLSEGTNLYYTDARADARVALIVDSAPGTLNTLNELAAALGDDANFSTTVTNSIATKMPLAGGTFTGNVTFNDGVRARFGNSSDMQIYHDGSNSIIEEHGDGNLYIRGANQVRLQGSNQSNMLIGNQGGSVGLYHNNSAKLETTSTGIQILDAGSVKKIVSYFAGDYTSGFKFSDLNGGIWYDAGADDLYLNANHTNSQIILQSGGSTTLTLNASNNATFAGIVGMGSTGIYAGTNAQLNLPGRGIAIKNDKNGSNNNWSYIYNTATTSGANIEFQTGSGIALTLNHDKSATFAGDVDIKRSSTGQILARVWNSNTGGNGTAVMRIANSGGQANGARLEFSDQDYYNATVSVDRTNGMRFMVHDDSNSMADLLTHPVLTLATNKAATFASSVTADQVITTNNGNGQNYRIGDDAWIGDINVANTFRISGNQNSANGYITFGNSSNDALGRAGTGALTWAGNTIWHAGNDGPGSGLNADLLDGIGSDGYLRSNANDTATGNLTLSSTDNHYQGHFYYDPYNAAGAHYPHFLDGSDAGGVDVNWRLYTGSTNSHTHIWNTTKARFVTRIESSIDMRTPIFYDIDDTTYYVNPASGSNLFTLDLNAGTVWDATTQGTTKGALHLDPNSGADHAGAAITFGASDHNNGQSADAGIYIRSDGSYGTKMYLSTTDSYASGSKTGLKIDHSGNVTVVRGGLYSTIFYDLNNTGYYVNPADFSRMDGVSFGVPGAGASTSGRYLSIEGNADSSGEGSARIFFTEHNSTTAAMSNYGMSIGYRGGGTSIVGADGNTWTGLSAIGNGQWGLWGHNNSAAGNLAMWGPREGTYVQATGSFRAPIFYDSNDTAYYVNPASNSNVNTINSFGFSQQGGADKILVTANNGYLQLNNWIHVGSAGLYSGSVNGAHFYPNGSSDYGAWRINGTRNGWSGITFDVNGANNTLMANEQTMGFYNDANNEWMIEAQRNSHVRFYYNGIEEARTDVGFFLLNNQARSPIYYDSADTSYYANLNSKSHLRKIAGVRTNLATSEGWGEVNAWNTGTQTGYFGGNFTINGSSNENNISWEDGPSGTRPTNKKELVWKVTTNSSDSGADGGWNKTITGIDYNKSHVSILYVKRVAEGNGNFYHGTTTCLNLNGTTNGNPYFQAMGSQSLPLNVWCVSIGFLRANNDTASTAATSWSGIYRLDTGERILGATDYRLAQSTTSQHRCFLYYSTNTATELWFANPGFYEINGNEPKLNEILMRPEDRTDSLRADVDMRAPIFYDSNNTSYFLNPSASGGNALKTIGDWRQTTDSWSGEVGGKMQYHGNHWYIQASGYVHFRNTSGTNTFHVDSGGVGYISNYLNAAGSLRAPIFYDSNNTNYYLDAHSTSNLNAATFVGTISGQNAYFAQDVAIGFTSGNIGGNLNVKNSAAGQIAAKLQLGSSVNSSSTGVFVNTTASYASSGMFLHFQSNHISGDDNVLIAYLDGDIVNKNNSYTQYSDEKLKENIVDATDKLEEVKQIKVRNFNFKGEDLKQIGVVAQELESIFPALVKEREVPGHEEPIKTVKYSVLVPILIKAMQEQQTIIDDLKSRVETLENN